MNRRRHLPLSISMPGGDLPVLIPTRNVVRANLLGAGLICVIYAACVVVFWKFF